MLPITKTAYTDLPSSGTASYSGAIDGTWNNKTAAITIILVEMLLFQ